MGITYQPDILHEIEFSYDAVNYWYQLQWKDWYLKIQPYAVYDGKEYTLKQIVPFLKNQYPAITYRQVVEKFAKYHRWGFWLEKLPPEISNKLDAVGYKLIDTNIPMSAFEVEHEPYLNVSRLNIGGKFTLDFSDLEARYNVSINKQGVHVTGITGLTDIDMDPITYSAPTITVTGYTEGTPCAFTDVYNADVAGGWGVVSRQGTNQFMFSCRMWVGDGTIATWFADIDKQVMLANGVITTVDRRYIRVRDNAVFRLGKVTTTAIKSTEGGCSILTLESTNWHCPISSDIVGKVYLYSSDFNSATLQDALIDLYEGRVWNCLFSARAHICGIQNGDVFNILAMTTSTGIRRPRNTPIDKITALSCSRAVWFQGASSQTAKNVYSRGATFSGIRVEETGAADHFIINGDFDAWTLQWVGTSTGKLYRQYTWNTLIKDNAGLPIQNANVTLYRADGTPAFSVLTAADGTIAEQTVSRGYYQQSTGDTLNDYGPFRLTVTAAGYIPHNTNSIILTEPIDWEIALTPPTQPRGSILVTPQLGKRRIEM